MARNQNICPDTQKPGRPWPDKKTGLRPWQPAFWDALMGHCPGQFEELKNDAGEPGSPLTPEALWDLACMYFRGENEDTMIVKDFIRSGDNAGKIVEMTTTRPFSWNSFEMFLLLHNVRYCLRTIRENLDKYPRFKPVFEQISNIIYQQKFDGAAIGTYNANLIIRDLGLSEKVEANVKQEQPLFVETPQPPVAKEEEADTDDLE